MLIATIVVVTKKKEQKIKNSFVIPHQVGNY